MYNISVFIHILAAMFWIGGMLFTVAVLVPASRNPLLSSKKGAFFTLIGKKFSKISWFLFVILLITGFTNYLFRGYKFQEFFNPDFWQAGYGYFYGMKLHLFGAVLIVSGFHDFYAGPKAAKLMEKEPQSVKTLRFRKISSWFGRLNVLLGLSLVYIAVRLARG